MKVITLFCASVIFIAIIGTSLKPEQQPKKNFTPTNDFSWLTDFYIISRCLSADHWEKDPNRKLDKDGIIMDKGNYHPVNLFQYAIYNFDKYRLTKDTACKTKFLNQAKFLFDTARYKTFDDGMIGFPYNITFRDLKPTWYSALAQSEGIMVMIRYYYLTKDIRALNKIFSMLDFMLKDQKDGGTFTKLNDSSVWLEEYPNSKSKPEVINGFVTSIIALNEYCHMFPDDKETKKILEQCIQTHKKRAYMYDKGNGILYDQGEKQQVGAWYMKFQVVQMEQMYDMFKDPFYKQLNYLYAYYAYNLRITNMTGCLLNDTNYSSPAIRGDNNIKSNGYTRDLLTPDQVTEVKGGAKMLNQQLIKNIFDGSTSSSYTIRNHDSIPQPLTITAKFKNPFKANRMNVTYAGDVGDISNYNFEYVSNDNSDFKQLKYLTDKKTIRDYTYDFPITTISGIKLTIDDTSHKRNISICEINFQNKDAVVPTVFSHLVIDSLAVPSKNFKLSFEAKDVTDYVIYYKLANSIAEMNKVTTWDYNQVIMDKNKVIDAKGNKMVKLLIIFKNKTNNAVLKNFKLIQA